MSLTVCVFEDSKYDQFLPLTHNRPVCLLRPGIYPLLARTWHAFPESSISMATRTSVAAVTAEQNPDFPVNIIKRGDDNQAAVLFVNGRLKEYGDLADQVTKARLTTAYKVGQDTIAVLFLPDSIKSMGRLATPSDYAERFKIERADIPDFECSAKLYEYPWELVADIKSAITEEFEQKRGLPREEDESKVDPRAFLINPDDILISPDTIVKPGALIDASDGPVYLGPNCSVDSQAAIIGPVSVGANSMLLAGRIEGSSLGHTCRVGGEVEESIFGDYVNKHHAGFIGHSYVGAWVNFGAMTTNSDLKNNYSNVRVTMGGETIDSGEIKFGSLIGDFTKTGIGTLLNTGINIGVCCNLFGGGLISDKEVKSFSWGSSGAYQEYRLEKAIETTRRTVKRRHHTLSAAEEKLLQVISSGKETTDGLFDFK